MAAAAAHLEAALTRSRPTGRGEGLASPLPSYDVGARETSEGVPPGSGDGNCRGEAVKGTEALIASRPAAFPTFGVLRGYGRGAKGLEWPGAQGAHEAGQAAAGRAQRVGGLLGGADRPREEQAAEVGGESRMAEAGLRPLPPVELREMKVKVPEELEEHRSTLVTRLPRQAMEALPRRKAHVTPPEDLAAALGQRPGHIRVFQQRGYVPGTSLAEEFKSLWADPDTMPLPEDWTREGAIE